jgi:hypothetical protein
LFYCTGSALSGILQQQNTCPNENLISKLVHLLREDLRKDAVGHVSKSEFISWSIKMITTASSSRNEATLQDIYQNIFLSPSRGGKEIPTVPRDDGTIDENSDNQTVSTPLDSLHPDFKDDETIATRDDEGN